MRALQEALDLIDQARGFPGFLPRVIDLALAPPAPAGKPGQIAGSPPGEGGLAKTYYTIARDSFNASSDLYTVADSQLPTAWRGRTAEAMSDAVQAVAAQATAAGSAFDSGYGALTTWAEKLVDAQRRDARGRELLEQAKSQAAGRAWGSPLAYSRFPDPDTHALGNQVGNLADEGCRERLAAAKIVEGAVSDVVDALNQLAATARARQINSPGIDPLSSVVLAYASDYGWSVSFDSIVSPDALARASQSLNAMSAADRAAFEKMLADAKSPQEAAYLWKALGAGYNLSDVQKFDQVIHPHGDRLQWLAQHLDPQINDPETYATGNAGKYTLSYRGQQQYRVPDPKKPGYATLYDFYYQFTDGDKNSGDCVASSTVMARAANDPVYMLGITTGQGPMAVGGAAAGSDTPQAFHKRLEQTYTTNYKPNAIDPTGSANTLLKPVTGSSYQDVSVGSPEQRQAALPRIEAAVDAGKPVPIDVDNGNDVHQMIILAARSDPNPKIGDELEIYNPWGFTEWVTKQQFIDGQLGELTSKTPTGGLPNPTDVIVPR